jgi:hypothetical protein
VIGCVELVDDIDRLSRHPQLRHERIVGNDLLLLHAGLGDQIIKLNTEHDFPILAHFLGEPFRHC